MLKIAKNSSYRHKIELSLRFSGKNTYFKHLFRHFLFLFYVILHVKKMLILYASYRKPNFNDWKLETLSDLYSTISIIQAVIFCDTRRRVDIKW